MAKRSAPRGYPKGHWTNESIRVLEERYLTKDMRGRLTETPEGMCYRVAHELALVEKRFSATDEVVEALTKEFYKMMVACEFMPNSPTLMNAGRGENLQYSACFVLPIGDSVREIFDAIKNAALIHQSGGGTGFNFTHLRPEGSIVKSTRGVASGPVSFMKVFDAATAQIKQGGMRRGANMGVLRVDHPDIVKFIESKISGGITNFNISVAITDPFMRAAIKGGDYWLYDPHRKTRTKKVNAREVFQKIVKTAWQTGDPGLIFIDRINAGPANPVPSMGPVEATNPCGEQPLYPNEACNLGSINLGLMVDGKKKDIDWPRLEKITKLSVRFLDNVIEVNPFPLEDIDRVVKANRRIGLGVMGWADLLFRLEIPYDSAKSVALARKIMKFIQKQAHLSSQELAKERGPFPNFSKSIYKDGLPLRNATLTTIAPTGSISIIANCSSGIEPLFALAYKHRANGRELTFVNPYFLEAAKRYHFPDSVVEEVKEKGVLESDKVPEKIKKVFVTAHQIAWKDHINTQVAFQDGTDNAVSKTINLPHEATTEEVEGAYLYAYKKGCMGITLYRDRCKDVQVLYQGSGNTEKEESTPKVLKIKPRPTVVSGRTYKVETPVGRAFITVNTNGHNEPLEVFINVGKAGSDIAADAEAIGRMISLALRLSSDFPPKDVLVRIVDQLSGIGGGSSIGFGKNRIRSLADGVSMVLKEHLEAIDEGKTISIDNQKIEKVSEQPNLPLSIHGKRDLCPSCGQATLIFEEGCNKCLFCGYNKC